MTNARSHDIWKTVAFSIASVGLFAVASFAPEITQITPALAVGAGVAAFGNGVALKCHGESIEKLNAFQANLHDYAKLVENDNMKATQKMMNFFDQAEEMITEKVPFNKKKWLSIIKNMSKTRPFQRQEQHEEMMQAFLDDDEPEEQQQSREENNTHD